ncbi:hypothetical protein NMY22_g10735 [Coprinellus aureogranulatus]|nr:hypothetical protein NMY22_g10735 [Coprinellus aureogranulatus]
MIGSAWEGIKVAPYPEPATNSTEAWTEHKREEHLGIDLSPLMDSNNPWSSVRVDYACTYTKIANPPPHGAASGQDPIDQLARQPTAGPDASSIKRSGSSIVAVKEERDTPSQPLFTSASRYDSSWFKRIAQLFFRGIVYLLIAIGLVVSATTVLGFLAFALFPQIGLTHVYVSYSKDGVTNTVDLAMVQDIKISFGPAINIVLGCKGEENQEVKPAITIPLEVAVPSKTTANDPLEWAALSKYAEELTSKVAGLDLKFW